MSINILQFLKQGVSSKKQDKKNFQVNQQKLQVKQKQINQDYKTCGKFSHNDSSQEENHQQQEQARLRREKYLTQKINHIKKLNNIRVQGDNYPPLCSNFTKIIKKYNIKQKLINRLSSYGFTKPTAVQMQSIPLLLQKRNALITAPTGSGKTISFALPLLQNIKSKGDLQAVIIEPFFELSEQVFKTVSDLGQDLNNIKIRPVSHIKNSKTEFDANILVSTPMAFITYFKQKPELLSKVQYLILDESDKYFEESFLEQIREILGMFASINPVYGLFSATIQHPVQQLLKQQILDDAVRVQVGGKNNVLNKIKQTLDYCSNEFGKLVEIKNMILNGKFVPPVLIFVQQKQRAKELFFELKKILKEIVRAPQRVEYVTAQKFKHNRQSILQKFDKGEIWVLVATDLMARGVDFKMVNLVINYDFPTSMLTYIHRVGRTGRGDREGTAVTFFTDEDKPQLRSLANLLKVSGCEVPEWIFNLQLSSKKVLKNIEKRPVMRESISRNPDKHVDPNWRGQMAMIQKKHEKKLKAEQKQKEDNEDYY